MSLTIRRFRCYHRQKLLYGSHVSSNVSLLWVSLHSHFPVSCTELMFLRPQTSPTSHMSRSRRSVTSAAGVGIATGGIFGSYWNNQGTSWLLSFYLFFIISLFQTFLDIVSVEEQKNIPRNQVPPVWSLQTSLGFSGSVGWAGNSHGNGNHHFLIGDTSSNGCFWVVINASFLGLNWLNSSWNLLRTMIYYDSWIRRAHRRPHFFQEPFEWLL